MSGYALTILAGAGFFIGMSVLFWGLFALVEWIYDRKRHACADALTWCEHCMDDKQRIWSAFLRGQVKA